MKIYLKKIGKFWIRGKRIYGKRPLSIKDRVDDYTLGLEDKKEKRKEKEEQESHWRNINIAREER